MELSHWIITILVHVSSILLPANVHQCTKTVWTINVYGFVIRKSDYSLFTAHALCHSQMSITKYASLVVNNEYVLEDKDSTIVHR